MVNQMMYDATLRAKVQQTVPCSQAACKTHGGDGGPSHGCVDGPIPPAKLKAFRSYRLLHRVEDPCVVGVDYF